MQTRILIFLLASLAGATAAQARDVTALVIKQTNYDERIAEACRQHCQGNRREGRLKLVDVRQLRGPLYVVKARADLVNRHDFGNLPLAGSVDWTYIVSVEATGVLDSRDCRLKIDYVRVINDQLGLGRLAEDARGKTHRIAGCRRFL